MRIFQISAAIYLAMAIFTFGHVAANHECRTNTIMACADQKAGAGTMSAFWWPLYWSWEIQDSE